MGGGNLGCGRRGRNRGEGADGDQIVNEGIGSGGLLIHSAFDSDCDLFVLVTFSSFVSAVILALIVGLFRL